VWLPCPEAHALWTQLGEWTVIVYPGRRGHSLTGMTDAQWKEVGTIVQRMHQAPATARRLCVPAQETFDPTGYAPMVRPLRPKHLHAHTVAVKRYVRLCASCGNHQSTILHTQ